MFIASGLTASFFVAGISAYRLIKGDTKQAPKLALKTGLVIAAVLAPLQALVGDFHGLNTFEYQPQKIAAMEGVWETETGAPLLLFAIPDEKQRTNHLAIGVPKLASYILTHDSEGEIRGLNEFEGNHPPVAPVFYGFRIMVSIGLLMIAVSWFSCWHLLVRKRELSTTNLKVVVAMMFSGWVATLAGWYVTEIGRQPWLVTGVLTTEAAVTPIAPHNVGISLILYCTVYLFLLLAYIHTLLLMARKSVTVEEFETQEPRITGELAATTTTTGTQS